MDVVTIPFAPKKDDVICVRKKGKCYHPGNLHYNSLVNNCVRLLMSQPQHHSIAELVDSILEDVMITRRGRFLQTTDDSKEFCVVLSRSDVARKVDLAIRKCRWRVKSAQGVHRTSAVTTNTQHSLKKKKKKKKQARKRKNTATTTNDHSNTKMTLKESKNNTPNVGSGNDDTDGESDVDDDSLSSASTAVPSFVCSPKNSWTFDNLYHHERDRNTNTINRQSNTLYGSPQDEMEMRRWLNDHRLPQSVGDFLLRHGARNIDDVIFTVESQPDLIQDLAFLDLLKLRRAVQGHQA